MKVYIIQKCGEDIIGVYADKEIADNRCAFLQEGLDDPWYIVEEYDVE